MHGRPAHATTGRVTTGTGDSVGGTDADGFARDWQALRADGDIQFAPLAQPEAQPPPDWWLDFVDFLERLFAPVADFFSGAARLIGVSGQALMWGLLGLGAVLTVLILWRYLPRLRRRKTGGSEAAEWSPEAGEALALLDDADRLAAEGRYDEATHLLLKRSVAQIAIVRPGLLDPSSTAREIASLPDLSEAARRAFATIATRVERSLFALRALTADDWQAARAAYADFALAVPQAR